MYFVRRETIKTTCKDTRWEQFADKTSALEYAQRQAARYTTRQVWLYKEDHNGNLKVISTWENP